MSRVLSNVLSKAENNVDSASEDVLVNMGDIRAKCDMWKVSFSRYCDFKLHIESTPKGFKVFNCDECDKSFVVKWRLFHIYIQIPIEYYILHLF